MRVHEKPLIFMHIPKTAGTTINQILYNEYKGEKIFTFHRAISISDFNKLSDSQKLEISVFNGHFAFGIHEYYPSRINYFTFLRNPIERAISGYNFIYFKKAHYFHQEMIKNQYSLKDMLNGGYVKNFDNCHVRFFSGQKDLEYGSINEESYKIALDNFNSYFNVFGICERFDESIFLFKKQFNWKMPFYIKFNVNQSPTFKEMDNETLELLNYYNRYDLALYQYACKKFDEIILKEGKGFQSELKRFQLLNKLQSPLRKAYVKLLSQK